MSLDTFEDTPNLGMHRYPSASLLRITRSNLLALDEVTRQGRPIYQGGFGEPQENVATNPYRESWGSFRALPGLTTLTVVIRSSAVDSGDVLRVYLNGALATTWALANGEQVLTAALGSYAINSVVEVVFEVYNASKPSGDASWGDFEIQDAYVGPVTLADAWPGVPTFTTTYSSAALLQLSRAVDWLVRRIGRRTEPLFQSIIRWNGPFTGQTTVRWYGGAEITPACNLLVAAGLVRVDVAGATETVRLRVNGVTVDSLTIPSTRGDHGYTLTYPLSGATGTRLPVVVDMVRTVAPPHSGDEPVSRWTLSRVEMIGSASIYPAISIPTVAARTNVSWSTFKAALQACADAANTIKARIDANPDLWSRQRLFRRRYAFDDYQDRVFEPGQIAGQYARRGEALLIRAKGARAAWGPGEFDNNSKNEVGLYAVKNYLEQGVCQGDTPRTELVYLDTLNGLYPTQAYNVRGEQLIYAAEILRVGTDVS
jgi:hypothetical protein